MRILHRYSSNFIDWFILSYDKLASQEIRIYRVFKLLRVLISLDEKMSIHFVHILSYIYGCASLALSLIINIMKYKKSLSLMTRRKHEC